MRMTWEVDSNGRATGVRSAGQQIGRSRECLRFAIIHLTGHCAHLVTSMVHEKMWIKSSIPTMRPCAVSRPCAEGHF